MRPVLAMNEYGDPLGSPCLYFHGIPGSRFEGALFHEAAAAPGVRLLAVDRPGIGLSPASPGRSVADLPEQVAELADSLGITRFAVFGWSGGGPYALACAALLPDRVTVTIVASSPAPALPGVPLWTELSGFRRQVWRLGTTRTWRLDALMWAVGKAFALLQPVATAAARRGSLPADSARGLREPWRQSAGSITDDLHAVVTDWGFALEDVRGTVHLWHGEQDQVVPLGMGQRLASRITDVVTHLAPGRHDLCVVRAKDVLADLPERT